LLWLSGPEKFPGLSRNGPLIRLRTPFAEDTLLLISLTWLDQESRSSIIRPNDLAWSTLLINYHYSGHARGRRLVSIIAGCEIKSALNMQQIRDNVKIHHLYSFITSWDNACEARTIVQPKKELMKPEARVFEITSPTKKISLNYHLNKFSQFKDKIR